MYPRPLFRSDLKQDSGAPACSGTSAARCKQSGSSSSRSKGSACSCPSTITLSLRHENLNNSIRPSIPWLLAQLSDIKLAPFFGSHPDGAHRRSVHYAPRQRFSCPVLRDLSQGLEPVPVAQIPKNVRASGYHATISLGVRDAPDVSCRVKEAFIILPGKFQLFQ